MQALAFTHVRTSAPGLEWWSTFAQRVHERLGREEKACEFFRDARLVTVLLACWERNLYSVSINPQPT